MTARWWSTRDRDGRCGGERAVTLELDLVVTGGTAVTTRGLTDEPVGVRDGRVVQIGGAMTARRTVDARGGVVVPGAVDPHVHLRRPDVDPVAGFADDFLTGTRAALAGGVTTVGHMSFPVAGESVREALRLDQEGLRAGAACDWFLHPSAVYADARTPDDLAFFAGTGHRTFKTTVFGLDATPDNDADGAAHLTRTFAAAAASGVTVLVHCEDLALIEHRTGELERAGLAAYPDSRPPLTERSAVERAVALAELTGAELYVVHVSSAQALDVVRAARARGVRVLAETRPIYLSRFADRYAEADGQLFVTMPPLRTPEDAEALWRGLADGTVDTIGSDHAPWTREQRATWDGTLTGLRKGVAELDTYYPLLVETAVHAGRLGWERLVEVVATAPARICGLPGKGRIEPGADADLVVLDPDTAREVDPARLESRAGHTPYDGTPLRGWPRTVLLRGAVVVEDGAVLPQTGGREADRGAGAGAGSVSS